MTKKASFILSLFSILSPVLLILLVILITLTENFFTTMHINNILSPEIGQKIFKITNLQYLKIKANSWEEKEKYIQISSNVKL